MSNIYYPRILDLILSIERGWSIIANLLNTRPSRLVDIVFNGTDDFTLEEINEVSRFFNVPVDDLYEKQEVVKRSFT